MGRIYRISQLAASVILVAALFSVRAQPNQYGGYGPPPGDATNPNYNASPQTYPPGQNYSLPDDQPAVTPSPGVPPAPGQSTVTTPGQPPAAPEQPSATPEQSPETSEQPPAINSAQPPNTSAQPPMEPIGTQGGGDWPRVYVIGNTTNTVYQPQIESWDGYNLVAHNAVAVQSADQPQPVYGVMTV